MSEPSTELQKEWERFDEISLKKVDIVDEESELEEVKGDKTEKKRGTADDTETKAVTDPLQSKTEDHEVEEVKVRQPAKPKPTVPSIPRIPVQHTEKRAIPRIPLVPHPSAPQKSPAYLDVSKLEDGTSGPAKASAISDPTNVNGKVLATVFPDNMICDWVTPPHYDAYSMPSILAIDLPSLTGEDYIAAIEAIIKDTRFKMFSTIYSRLIAIWMTIWIFSLAITLLLQSQGGWPVMIWCLVWAVLLFVGVYVCAMIRKRIRIGLNHVVEKANKIIVDRHFLTGVEDRGQLSCHKVVIHFIRFNVGECTAEVIKQLKIKNSGGCVFGGGPQLEPNDESFDREAAALIMEYSQEYVKSVVKKRLIFPKNPVQGVSNYAPKHCKTQMCLCQFIDEKKFNAKQRKWYERYI
ncbi:unnamed protein product [Caenorhabditis sp. 36 PRJEB53466]|nr:unnamed protein product [Caenorhabditis sp. 36 PRJEB53466]